VPAILADTLGAKTPEQVTLPGRLTSPKNHKEIAVITPNFNTPAISEMVCPCCGVIDLPRLGAGSGPHAARADCAHCGDFLRWLPKSRTPEERAEKDAKAGLRRSACMREKLPTPRQIQFLQQLGYCGPRPSNRLEASGLITGLLGERG